MAWERHGITQLFTNISHFTPLSFSLPKCTHTQTRLNPANFRGDQQWHKTGSERKEDSVITKAADLAPFNPVIYYHKQALITIWITASAIFNRHSLAAIQISVILQNKSSGFLLLVSVPGVLWFWSMLTTINVHLLNTLVFIIWCECRAGFPHRVKPLI